MIVLAFNCGSSTLKFRVMDVDRSGLTERRLAWGMVDGIGATAESEFSAITGEHVSETLAVGTHRQAAYRVLEWLAFVQQRNGMSIEAVGHRVVHGGSRLAAPALLDDAVVGVIADMTLLAPLHNAPSLAAIAAAREHFGPGVPQVATFDTAFHASMPERASLYALPFDLTEKYGIRRFGFHGLAHRYMAERCAALAGAAGGELKLITLQLGNGCSAAAVDRGRSVDTSMGFTPLEGLMMGTRSGDLDPSLVSFLADREKVTAQQVEDWLNLRSGLLGVSGRSRDVRFLSEAASSGDPRSALALEMFSYRVRKCIGAYLAVLGGADAIVFGGGIGENAAAVRSGICAGMEWCGLRIDQNLNEAAAGREMDISAPESGVRVWVVPVDEEVIIARDTVQCLKTRAVPDFIGD